MPGIDEAEARRAYETTGTDREAAGMLGIGLMQFWRWRTAAGLPVQHGSGNFGPRSGGKSRVRRVNRKFAGGLPGAGPRGGLSKSEIRKSVEQVVREVAADDLVETFFDKAEAREMLGDAGHFADVWREAMERACRARLRLKEAPAVVPPAVFDAEENA